MDEQPVQLLKETWQPIEATAKHGKRVDYAYERAGTASIFMFTEPATGWRQATVRKRRTKMDWASEVASLMDGRYAECQRLKLVYDNLNTHTKGAFYETFEPERGASTGSTARVCLRPKTRQLAQRAENELSAMTRHCVSGRRFETIEILRGEIAAWSTDTNHTQRGVDWQMKVEDARCKLVSIYPQIKI